MQKRFLMSALFAFSLSHAQEVKLEEVSVTATRVEREVKDTPAGVSVISEEKIKDKAMIGLYEALQGIPGVNVTSRNMGYDTRLIIRGGGLKAPFGIREIMVLLNGVPITDPDSLTRLDFVDTYLIKQVEVVKGPNSTMWGINASGGVVNVITKSPIERKGGQLRFGVGDYSTYILNAYYSTPIGSSGWYLGFNASRRQTDNSWRHWNEFKTTQFTLQPAYLFSNGDVWENYISYTKADLQLPGPLVVNPARGIDQWKTYKETGTVEVTADPWKHMGRYSEILFFSSKLNKTISEKLELAPLVYINKWSHYHPVTGRINDADTKVYGTDIQLNYKQSFGILITGLSFRSNDQKTKYYKYAEVQTIQNGPQAGRIIATLSDRAGDLSEIQKQDTNLYGVFIQESINLKSFIIDLGVRYDRVTFDISGQKWSDYNFSTGKYENCTSNCIYSIDKDYNFISPRVGITYKAFDWLSLYASYSTAGQTPASGEIQTNPNLDLSRVYNYEVGMKARTQKLYLDLALYYMPVEKEVVRVVEAGGKTNFVNAGKTDKKGFELSTSYALLDWLSIGLTYAYSDYKFKKFSEPVRVGNTTITVSRDGNRLPYVPMHQYSLFAKVKHSTGIRASLDFNTWGSYYMDNANTEKYQGYQFLTNLSVGYEKKNWDLSVSVDNLFDKRYAIEVTKDTDGVKRYRPATPRSVLVKLSYNF